MRGPQLRELVRLSHSDVGVDEVRQQSSEKVPEGNLVIEVMIKAPDNGIQVCLEELAAAGSREI